MPDSVTSADHKALVAALIDVRRAARLSRCDLAERLEKPTSFVAKAETNERNLSVVELIA